MRINISYNEAETIASFLEEIDISSNLELITKFRTISTQNVDLSQTELKHIISILNNTVYHGITLYKYHNLFRKRLIQSTIKNTKTKQTNVNIVDIWDIKEGDQIVEAGVLWTVLKVSPEVEKVILGFEVDPELDLEQTKTKYGTTFMKAV